VEVITVLTYISTFYTYWLTVLLTKLEKSYINTYKFSQRQNCHFSLIYNNSSISNKLNQVQRYNNLYEDLTYRVSKGIFPLAHGTFSKFHSVLWNFSKSRLYYSFWGSSIVIFRKEII